MLVQLNSLRAVDPETVRAVFFSDKEVTILFKKWPKGEVWMNVNKEVPKEEHLTVREVVLKLNKQVPGWQPSRNSRNTSSQDVTPQDAK